MTSLGDQGRIPRGAVGGEQGKGGVNGKERGKEFQTEVCKSTRRGEGTSTCAAITLWSYVATE